MQVIISCSAVLFFDNMIVVVDNSICSITKTLTDRYSNLSKYMLGIMADIS
jgi:hypothetical protein